MMLLPFSVASADTPSIGSTVDVLGAIGAIARTATSTRPTPNSSIDPTAEQRVAIIASINRDAGEYKPIVDDAQQSIQSILEASSCDPANRQQDNTDIPSSTDSRSTGSLFTSVSSTNVCANIVQVYQWQVSDPDILEFTAVFRPVNAVSSKSWHYQIQRQASGGWILVSQKYDIN